MSLRVVKEKGFKKDDLLREAREQLKAAKLQDHADVATELAVPDRKSRALGTELSRLAEGNTWWNAQFKAAEDALGALAKTGDANDYADFEKVFIQIARIDALLSLDNAEIHNRFHSDRITSELLKDRKDIFLIENAKVVASMGVAMQVSMSALKLRGVAQFLKSKPVFENLLKQYEIAHPIMTPTGDVVPFQVIEKAIDAVLNTPVGPMMATVLRHFEPSIVDTVLGSFPACYRDANLDALFAFDDADENEFDTTGTKDDDGAYTSYRTKLAKPIAKYVEQIVTFYQRFYSMHQDASNHAALGFDILKFSPVRGTGSWGSLYDKAPLLHSPTNWSIPADSILEAGFMFRLPAYTTDNQHGLTREDGVMFIQQGTQLKTVGLRGAQIDAYDLTDDIKLTIAGHSDQPMVNRLRFDFQLSLYRPYNEWQGEGGASFKERNISIAAIARTLGMNKADAVAYIKGSSTRGQDLSHLFDIPLSGEVTLKTDANPAWITWKQQQDPKHVTDISVPYWGPKTPILRTNMNTWTKVLPLAQWKCTNEEEKLGFETATLANGGNIELREVQG
jgi:hypothetical protein